MMGYDCRAWVRMGNGAGVDRGLPVSDAQIQLPGMDEGLFEELDDIADEYAEVQIEPEPQSQAVAPSRTPSPSRPPVPVADGSVRFPLLDTAEAPCTLTGPFACVMDTDIPAIMVYRTRAQLATRPGVSGGTREFLGVVTHDADEQDIARHFGPGEYQLAVKGPTGFIRWGRLSIGAPRAAGGSGRVVLAQASANLGGLPADEPPAWARSMLARLDELDKRAAPVAPVAAIENLVKEAETMVKHVESLGALGERLRALNGHRAIDAQTQAADDDEEEEPGIMDYTVDQLGGMVASGVKLKGMLDEFKALVGSST